MTGGSQGNVELIEDVHMDPVLKMLEVSTVLGATKEGVRGCDTIQDLVICVGIKFTDCFTK